MYLAYSNHADSIAYAGSLMLHPVLSKSIYSTFHIMWKIGLWFATVNAKIAFNVSSV